MTERPSGSEELVTICAVCSRVADGKGGWAAADEPGLRHSKRATHAICPECGRRNYPGYADAEAG